MQSQEYELIEQELESDVQQGDESGFDYDAWFRAVEELRQAMQTQHGGTLPTIDVVSLLRDIRDGEDE